MGYDIINIFKSIKNTAFIKLLLTSFISVIYFILEKIKLQIFELINIYINIILKMYKI